MTICPHCKKQLSAPRLGLTEEQRQLLDYIKRYRELNRGRSPTYDEMRRAMHLASKSGIHRMVHALIERGHLMAMPNRARVVVPVDA